MVDDDDGNESPFLEPRTDSRLALPREIRAWRWLRVVKRDENFLSDFFLPEREYMELELRSVEVQGAHEIGGRALGGAPPISWTGCGPPGINSFAKKSFNSKKCLRGFSGHSENFSFLHIKQHHGSFAENSVSPD